MVKSKPAWCTMCHHGLHHNTMYRNCMTVLEPRLNLGCTMILTKSMVNHKPISQGYRYSQWKITSVLMVNFDKNMKFCILVVHDLTNNISYDATLKRSKNFYFWGKIVEILWINHKKLEHICSIHICWYIGIKVCTVVVHILNKDISYDSKLSLSKN